MLYNLVQYLVAAFPDISFVAEAFSTGSPDDCILIQDTGGTTDHYSGRPDITIQFLSRSKNNWVARNNVNQVYEYIKNRIGLLLPEATVNSVVYPELTAYRIVPIQRFGYIGASNENHHMYSFNSIVTLDYS